MFSVAPGRLEVKTDNIGAIVSEKSFWSDCISNPLACTVKLNVPAVVGFPLMTPEELRLRPGGSGAPDTKTQPHGVSSAGLQPVAVKGNE